jgi:hypothetical protein
LEAEAEALGCKLKRATSHALNRSTEILKMV